MGSRNLGVQESCSWAMPAPTAGTGRAVSGASAATASLVEAPSGALYTTDPTISAGTFFDYANAPRPQHRRGSTASTRVVSPLPRFEDAPASFDVRAVGPANVNYASPSRNQHIPQVRTRRTRVRRRAATAAPTHRSRSPVRARPFRAVAACGGVPAAHALPH